MNSLRRVAAVTPLLVCALALASCGAGTVHSFLERGVDLGRYQHYDWGPDNGSGTGDPRLDNNEIFQGWVRAAVEKQLAMKGFEKTTSGSPELLVHFHARVEQRMDLTDTDRYAACPDCKPFIYDAGTLLIDLVDAHTGQLLWRGWSEGNVSGVIDSQRWLEERIDADVSKIFKGLPRGRG
jgi:hypothetical protein